MCLGVPGVVIEIEENTAVVDFDGIRLRVDTFLVPDVRPGDFVIVHAGSIIAKLSEEEAMEVISAWRELLAALGGESV